MEFVWGSIFLVGVVATADTIYQIVKTGREIKIISRKEFFPLNFEIATGFQFVQDQVDPCMFNVFDSDNMLVYKISKKQRQKSYFKEEWVVVNPLESKELATITVGSLFEKSHVYFNLSNRYSDPAHFCNSAGAQGPHPQVFSSSILTSISDTSRAVTPYVDSSLAHNLITKLTDLGPVVVLRNTLELRRFEVRNLYKIIFKTERLNRSSNFKVSKNSMRYSWKANGYLEKSPKSDLDSSCERIGMVRFKNETGTNFMLYINERRIEALIGITTAFLHYKSSLWKFKNLVSKS